ncbi:hypothetical protein HMH05_19535 [Pseudomonas sp. SbB1]|nr:MULTISPECIES: hypothetical protein [Pseudomonas]ELF6208681.1 hypothetical protein [Pseudomonas putida]MBP0707862.1 hypothetical protein [Pseudomonas sp. T34]MCK2187302.1 hypothetical protein [Pseudomonas sp. MB04B]MDD2085449.1 hypothetical protein [Pseudomonas putida]MDD2095150.1 hypothetical protein [Pseudomonas putida]
MKMFGTPTRLSPRAQVRHRLFALSGNNCALPGCASKLVDDYGNIIGQICHIEAAAPGGERFNPNSNNEARRDFSNLMLLCYSCHIKTNDVVEYPTERLRQIKATHEQWATLQPVLQTNIEKFVDASLWQEFKLPENYRNISNEPHDEDFYTHAKSLLTTIAQLPMSTRSFYAHAFIKALRGDLWLVGNLDGLRVALNTTYQQISTHISILEEKHLFGLVEEADDWMTLPFRGTRYGLCGLDRDDNGIYLLYLIHQHFSGDPQAILSIFEDLDFTLLDA